MKIKNCLVASAALVVASCSSTDNTVVTTRPTVVTKPQTQMSGQYLALPGQAAVAVSSDVNSAFDAQVAQYNGQAAAASHMGNAMSTAAANTVAGALAPLQQSVTQPDASRSQHGLQHSHLHSPVCCSRSGYCGYESRHGDGSHGADYGRAHELFRAHHQQHQW